MQRRWLLTAGAVVCVLGAPRGFATALPLGGGTLTIQNLTGTFAGFTIAPFCFNWAGGATCAGASHQMTVLGSSSNFAVGNAPNDTIRDFTSAYPVIGFETVAGAGTLTGQTVQFDLLSLPLTNGGTGFGVCSNAAFTSCSPANSPFTLSEDGTGTIVTISFNASMIGYTGSNTSGSTPYLALFSTQQSGTMTGFGTCNGLIANILNILSCEGSGGTISGSFGGAGACVGGVNTGDGLPCNAPAPAGFNNGTWSSTQTVVPEPISVALMGSGLLGLLCVRRRLTL